MTLQSTRFQQSDRETSEPAQSSTKLCPLTTCTQQQPPPDCLTGVLVFILKFGLSLAAVAGPILFFISAAIVTNACSTFVALFALVSRNGMRSWSAYSCNNHHQNGHSYIQYQIHYQHAPSCMHMRPNAPERSVLHCIFPIMQPHVHHIT